MTETDLLTAHEYARYRRCSVRTLDRERADGRGCPFVRLGARVLYRRADIDAWIERHVDNCGRFLDGGWADKAAALGWGPLDLFGCDRERPFARIDHLGLLWLLDGGTVLEIQRDHAIIETPGGARQTYRRRPVEVGRVMLAWERSMGCQK